MNTHRFAKATFLLLANALVGATGWIMVCQYSTTDWGTNLQQVYSCEANVTDDGNLDITAVTGSLDAGKTQSDVLFFRLMNYHALRISKIPSNLAIYFPNLRGIYWPSSKLETITATDLQPFPNLVYLDLSYNLIRKLDGDLFKYTPQLVTLQLSYNFIDYIGAGLFNGVTGLKWAYFFINICLGISQPDFDLSEDYSIARLQADLEHLCGPLDLPTTCDSCSANCISRFDAIETKISALEVSCSEPWIEKVKSIYNTAMKPLLDLPQCPAVHKE